MADIKCTAECCKVGETCCGTSCVADAKVPSMTCAKAQCCYNGSTTLSGLVAFARPCAHGTKDVSSGVVTSTPVKAVEEEVAGETDNSGGGSGSGSDSNTGGAHSLRIGNMQRPMIVLPQCATNCSSSAYTHIKHAAMHGRRARTRVH